MPKQYKIVYSGGSGEIVEKKSRFIATVKPVASEREAIEFIEDIKKKNRNATHNCTAFTIGKNDEIMRSSDDGEPSGTAGKPMLEVLTGMELHNVAVVVTRYFGGVLLGTGGLVRAYGRAVKAGLQNCTIVTKRIGIRMQINTDYSGIGKIQYIIRQMELMEINTEYTENVAVDIVMPDNKRDDFVEQIIQVTAGRAVINNETDVYYGTADDTCIFFDD